MIVVWERERVRERERMGENRIEWDWCLWVVSLPHLQLLLFAFFFEFNKLNGRRWSAFFSLSFVYVCCFSIVCWGTKNVRLKVSKASQFVGLTWASYNKDWALKLRTRSRSGQHCIRFARPTKHQRSPSIFFFFLYTSSFMRIKLLASTSTSVSIRQTEKATGRQARYMTLCWCKISQPIYVRIVLCIC